MQTVKSKSPVDLHKQIEVQYKNYTIKKPNSFAKYYTVYDPDGVGHMQLHRDIESIKEAEEYVDELIREKSIWRKLCK
jgi:hypothetical protein